MTSARYILLAAAGSAALLLGALAFQFIGQMPPCKLCYWQRYPHVIAIAIGAIALVTGWRLLAWLCAIAAFASAAVGAYHTGVERGWWEGPSTCTSGPVGGLSGEDLMAQIMAAPLVRCDEVPWEFFTLSMASWNMLISLGVTTIWIMALRAKA
jgi:disulfide bond formation protein DsbB